MSSNREYKHIYIGQQWYKLEYWRDGPWYAGRLIGKPSIKMSQGKTLEQLEENIRDTFVSTFEKQMADALIIAKGGK